MPSENTIKSAGAYPKQRGTSSVLRETVSPLLCITSCMALPIVFSYLFFLGQSLRLDEAQSLWQTSRSFGDIFTVVAGDVHVPLYHIVLRFWRLYVGESITSARALSLLFYVISIPALYEVASYAYNRRVALFSILLFSLSPFMNWYGNEVRMYTLFTFFVILNQYFYLRILREKTPRDGVWAGYILTALLGVFTHYFFFLNLAAEALFYFLRRDLFARGSFKRFVFAAGIVGVCFVPWGLYVVKLGTAGFQEPVLALPSSVDFFNAFGQFLYGFQTDNINTFFLSLWPITVILGLIALRRNRAFMPESEYFLATILLSFGIAFFGSFVIAPVFVSRYLIFTIPSLYILLASLFENYLPPVRNMAQWSFACLMIAGLMLEIVNPTMPVKENYAQAVAFINDHVNAQDSVILSAPFTIYPVQYYYRGSAPLLTLPIWNQYTYGAIPVFTENNLPQEVKEDVGASQDIYLLLSYNQGYENNIKNYFDSHYQMVYQQNFSNDLNLYVYKARYDTSTSAIASRLQ
ncbi:MAG TPA: glycosyltransferase family 39 protein [Candidatus Paceibacterota bacterium]|nr:glycosyltransferase family 39 protein [Candidatus Paceibacterota bacterium]